MPAAIPTLSACAFECKCCTDIGTYIHAHVINFTRALKLIPINLAMWYVEHMAQGQTSTRPSS